MRIIKLDQTKFTPKVYINSEKRIFEISGLSLPENVENLYNPILEWLDEFQNELNSDYLNNKQPLKFEMKLTYFNTISSRYVIEILKKFHSINQKGLPVEINWYADSEDTQHKETGKEFSEIVGIHMNFIEY